VAEKDYYSFEEVLKNLKLEEDQLKRLVSAGEIRAFRDKDTMRFKAEDVDRLKGGGNDDLVLEDDLELDLDTPAAAPAARVTEEIELEPGDELVLEDPAGTSQVVEIDLGGGDEPAAEAPAKPARTRVTVADKGARKAAPRTAVVAEPAEEAKDGVGTMALLLVGCVILIAANFVVLDALSGRPSNAISEMVLKLF
jgi:hypothetical protein